jgi:hypothetical protein
MKNEQEILRKASEVNGFMNRIELLNKYLKYLSDEKTKLCFKAARDHVNTQWEFELSDEKIASIKLFIAGLIEEEKNGLLQELDKSVNQVSSSTGKGG